MLFKPVSLLCREFHPETLSFDGDSTFFIVQSKAPTGDRPAQDSSQMLRDQFDVHDRSSIVHTRARRGPAAVPAVIPPSNIEKAHGTLLTPPTAANAGGGQRCVSSPHDTAHLRSLCHSLSSAARSTYAPHRSSEPIAAPHPTVARNVCSCCCSEPSAACRSASSASSPIT